VVVKKHSFYEAAGRGGLVSVELKVNKPRHQAGQDGLVGPPSIYCLELLLPDSISYSNAYTNIFDLAGIQ
jgi:hypothetical protein